LKVFMLWDMEGVSGIFTREHVWFWEPGARDHIAEEGRRLLMADVNSAVAAALDAGVDELIVCDTRPSRPSASVSGAARRAGRHAVAWVAS
jgi:D-aminopeptidase